MEDTARVVVTVLLAAFVIERITAALMFFAETPKGPERTRKIYRMLIPAVPFCHRTFSAARPSGRHYERVRVPPRDPRRSVETAAVESSFRADGGREDTRRLEGCIPQLGDESPAAGEPIPGSYPGG
jgi:hypothetical protein